MRPISCALKKKYVIVQYLWCPSRIMPIIPFYFELLFSACGCVEWNGRFKANVNFNFDSCRIRLLGWVSFECKWSVIHISNKWQQQTHTPLCLLAALRPQFVGHTTIPYLFTHFFIFNSITSCIRADVRALTPIWQTLTDAHVPRSFS